MFARLPWSLNTRAGADGSSSAKGGKRKRTYGDDGLLFRVCWRRVVLDEAQNIKNHNTKVAQAAAHLAAEHRRGSSCAELCLCSACMLLLQCSNSE